MMFGNSKNTKSSNRLSKARRFIHFQLRVWPHCARLLIKERANQKAAALAYYTIFGIVPLGIVVLLFFQALPAFRDVGDRLTNIIYDELQLSTIQYETEAGETVRVTDQIDDIIQTFFAGAGRGTITIVNVVIIVYAATILLSMIERIFNQVWHVIRGRSILHRIINYWAILTLGPLLIGAGIYVSAQAAIAGRFQDTVGPNVGAILFSYLMTLAFLFLLYYVLPNTKVKPMAALWGAAIAALVWSIARWGFGLYVSGFIPYSQVYGVLGLIPLTILWAFITWMIILFGLELAYATQHLETLESEAAKRDQENFIATELVAISIVKEIAENFQQDKVAMQGENIFSLYDIPGNFGEKLLTRLVDFGILAITSEPEMGYLPAKDPSHIKLSDISEAVEKAGFAKKTESKRIMELGKGQQDFFGKYTLRDILETDSQQENSHQITGQ